MAIMANGSNGSFFHADEAIHGEEAEHPYHSVQKKQEEVLEATRSQLESIAEKLQQAPSTSTDTATTTTTSTQQDEQTQTDGNGNILADTERSEILEMVQQLMKKVEEKSTQLNEQFQEFHEKLQVSKHQDSSDMVDTLNKRFRTRQTIHSIELESNSRQHLQQVMDMSGQLESYEEQVERQQEALLDLTAKYEELESIAVTSEQAREVLKAIESLDENHVHDDNDDDASGSQTREAREEVQVQVVEILRRMAIMHSRNQREKLQLDNLLEAAKAKERESDEELAHLNLQMEILQDETKIPPEEFAQNMAYQRMTHKKQLTEILRREEKRLLQMEYLEVRLTEMAFTAVEIEELKAVQAESKWEQQNELEAFRSRQTGMHGTLKTVKSQVTDLLAEQQKTVQDLETSIFGETSTPEAVAARKTKRPAPKPDQEVETLKVQVSQLAKVRQLEEALAKRDEELAHVKKELTHSQRRVEELEIGMAKYPSDSECTSPLSSRSST